MGILASGMTDIGMKRSSNQDSICLYPQKASFALADGMGGHSGGDIASGMCRELFPKLIDESLENNEAKPLEYAIKKINQAIFDHAQANSELKGMGTTITAVKITSNQLSLANVGDSRTYLFKNQQLFQLTKDHSLVQEKLNLGIYNRDQANKDPQKNILTRTVGFEERVDIDNFSYSINQNDLFLLCSDGLHGKVSDEDICYLMNKFLPEPSHATQQDLDELTQELINVANNNGGQDNISVILILCQ